LAGYFATTANAFRVDATVAHSQRVREAFERLPAALQGSWEDYVDAIATDVDRLPAVRQHGDFSVTNLGMHGDALVILDWEDYGRECVPGYDLALLLLALNDFSAARVRENTLEGAMHAWILHAGSEGTGIPTALFLRLLPAYLALTIRMKDEAMYGNALRSRAINALPEALRGVTAQYGAGERQ
ncbi:MAG: phosphotransferase, partial [Betaproteobacteria bacterium]